MRVRKLAIVACSTLASMAMDCGPEWPEPSYERVAGDYSAHRLELIEHGGATRNLIEEGVQIEISLRTDRTTTGRFFVPGGAEDGSDLEVDLTGTWHIAVDDEITLDHAAETLLRRLVFYWNEGGELYGEGDLPGSGFAWVVLVPEGPDLIRPPQSRVAGPLGSRP